MALGPRSAEEPAAELVRERVIWQEPLVPGLARGAVRRWDAAATWMPPETAVLARHRSHDGSHRLVSNLREAPDGYTLEYDLGVVQQHEQPGTARLLEHDGRFSIDHGSDPPERGVRILGHVEQAAFPMMDVLELRRVTATGQVTLAAGADDPLMPLSAPVATLGFVEGFPIQPRRVELRRLPPRDLAVLVRRPDAPNWRHVYESMAYGRPTADDALALGTLWTRPGKGFEAIRRRRDGRIIGGMLGAAHEPSTGLSRLVGHGPASVRFVGAPIMWASRPRAWALRASAARLRHLVSPPPVAAHEAALLGFIRTTPALGFSPLYSASHPVLDDQYLTRSRREASDMGYRIDGLLGYVGDLGAARHPGAHEILWSSRFGHARRYVED